MHPGNGQHMGHPSLGKAILHFLGQPVLFSQQQSPRQIAFIPKYQFQPGGKGSAPLIEIRKKAPASLSGNLQFIRPGYAHLNPLFQQEHAKIKAIGVILPGRMIDFP